MVGMLDSIFELSVCKFLVSKTIAGIVLRIRVFGLGGSTIQGWVWVVDELGRRVGQDQKEPWESLVWQRDRGRQKNTDLEIRIQGPSLLRRRETLMVDRYARGVFV